MKQKNKRINIRLTEEEYQMIGDKSKNYPSVSSFIIDACNKFDDRRGIRNLEFLMNFSSVYAEEKSVINKTASNINQIAHYANMLKKNGVMSEAIIKEFIVEIDKWNNCLSSMIVLNSKIENIIRKM
jgi:hypothetical protein